ncbi:hypothetical protein [Nostoc sp. 'Peltigera membranacea cyanobiont' 232]|uniref:hypothetical protein n=1 Tax=Nostoc sp. 'Peltigera membranacea cyanobiont' 232 TaxID=2014531 RepID=UPI001671C6C2|nr:hypothetical protein [Nostoc sp. 'Peltigera membranacea cyanobiont' 232]
MKSTTEGQLFTEITTEEAANINGGNLFQPVANWINDRINETKKAVQTVVNYYRFRR